MTLDLPRHAVAEAMDELSDARLIDEVSETRYEVRDLVSRHAEVLDIRPDSERAVERAQLIAYYHRRVVDAGALVAPSRPWRQMLFTGLQRTGVFDGADDPTDVTLGWLRRERANLLATVYFLFYGDE